MKVFRIGNNPDFIIIDENEDSIKTEQIKELTKDVLEKPIQGSKKIYIINNSENMTKEAQNSLLKTLEEPPEYAIIILITCNENMLLNTIKSRCIKISFQRLTDEDLKQYFKQNNKEINDKLLKAIGGSIEKALNINDKIDIYNKTEEIFDNIEQYNELQILNLKETIFNNKEDAQLVLEFINTLLYYKTLNNTINAKCYAKCIKIIEETKLRLKRNANYDMTIDNCLLAIWEVFELNG